MDDNVVKKSLQNLLSAFSALVFALIISGLIMLAMGINPIETYAALIKGAFGGSVSISGTLSRWVPTALCGLAIAIGFKGSVFNVGAEGQLIMGALAAAVVGYYVHVPSFLHIPMVMLAGMFAGILCIAIPTALRFKRNVNVIFTTIMFNYIAKYILQYLVNNPFSAADKQMAATEKIQTTARLPVFFTKPFTVNLGVVIAVAAVILVYVFISKTRGGYEMRATGMNLQASTLAGVNVRKHMILAMLLSGAIAGLAGALDVQGSAFRAFSTYSPGYGSLGITVSLLAKNNPLAIVLTSLLFAALKNGSVMMQTTGNVSSELVSLIQGLIIFFICCENLVRYIVLNRRKKVAVHA